MTLCEESVSLPQHRHLQRRPRSGEENEKDESADEKTHKTTPAQAHWDLVRKELPKLRKKPMVLKLKPAGEQSGKHESAGENNPETTPATNFPK